MKYEFRAHIGGRWTDGDDPVRYNWPALRAGTIGTNFDIKTTATSPISVTNGTIYAASTAAFPAAGHIHIQPAGSGEGWLFATYTGKTAATFNGVKWPDGTADIEGSYTISAGAIIRQFIPLDGEIAAALTDTMTITKSALGQFAGYDWSASVSGYHIVRHAIRNHHMIVIEYRTQPTNAWAILLIGWLEAPNFSDDHTHNAPWSVNIISAAAMMERYDAAGLTAGDRDIAQKGTASASNTLALAYKERHSGDFTAANPQLGAAQVVDGSLSSVWIADQMVGTYNYAASNGDPHWGYTSLYDTQVVFSLIYLQRPAGYDSVGYRFIELTVVPQPPDGTTNLRSHWIRSEKNGLKHLITPLEKHDVEEGEKLLIVENRDLFLKEHPTNAAADFAEITDQAFWDSIDPAGDTLILTRQNVDQNISHMVSWGNATGIIPQDGDDPGEDWIGPQATAPARGEALTYVFLGADGLGTSTTPADYWRTDYNMAPGYTIGYYGGDPDGWNQGKINEVWLKIELPELQLYLEEDMDTGDGAGTVIRIIDATGNGNTQGLPATGQIQIGYEQIGYSSKTQDTITITGRGLNGTDIATHLVDDAILFLYNGVATASPPIRELKWQRARAPYPENFRIYTSNGALQRTPGDDDWQRDWTLRDSRIGFVANESDPGAYTWAKQFDPPIRASHVLMVFYGMTTTPARPRLNRFIATVSSDEYQATTWMEQGKAAALIAADILINSGSAPGGSITAYATTLDALSLDVEPGPAFSTALDVIDYSHGIAKVGLDSHIDLEPHPWLQSSILSPTSTWNRGNTIAAQEIQPAPGAIKQYKMTYSVPAEPNEDRTVIWPPAGSAPRDGNEMEIGPYIAASEAAATNSARWRYQLARIPYQTVIQISPPGLDLHPCEIHSLTWDFGPAEKATGPRFSRLMVVESVDHYFDAGRVATTLHLLQIGRTTAG